MVDFNSLHQLTKNLNVLYIEDDKNLRDETKDVFENIFKSVDIAFDGEMGLSLYKQYFKNYFSYYDIVITDISMPKMDGIELIKSIYDINETQKIIVISAHNNQENLLKLVNIGIEHFLMKPFQYDMALDVLYKCSKKVLSIKHKIDDDIIILADKYVWNKKENSLNFNGENIKLTKKEFLLMSIFIKNGSKVSTLEEIFTTLWQDEADLATIESLKSIISRFRKKIPNNEIENIYGLGYKLIF